MRIVSILGSHPQRIQAAPVSRVLAEMDHSEIILHTGQPRADGPSCNSFRELSIPMPAYHLGVDTGPHGCQTGAMQSSIEEILTRENPDWVLVYGDSNATLAGALAASKLRLPLAHVEAGLRSFNHSTPEEHNRVLADHCSDLLFCPTHGAVRNLEREGVRRDIERVGDTTYDAVLQHIPLARKHSGILEKLDLHPKKYLFAAIHMPCDMQAPEVWKPIFRTLSRLDETVVVPVHPRTRQMLIESARNNLSLLGSPNLCLVEPTSYLDMLALKADARMILTDVGGIQKEAYLLGVPCVTLRQETEWQETVDSGWNTVVATDPKRIVAAVRNDSARPPWRRIFGSGDAALKIVGHLTARLGSLFSIGKKCLPVQEVA